MHALPSHPKHPLAFGLLVLLLALFAMAAAAPDLGTLDFSLGGGATPTTDAVSTGNGLSPTPAVEPTWVSEPLAPPVQELRAAR